MRCVILGCGRVGHALASTLIERGHQTTIIDKDARAIAGFGPRFTGQTLIGSGFDRSMLVRAGIEQCDGFAAVTGSDEVNVGTAQLARHIFHVPKTVTRVYDPRKAELCRRLGIQPLNPVTWGSNRMHRSTGTRTRRYSPSAGARGGHRADEVKLVATSLARFEFHVPRTIARVHTLQNAWMFTDAMGVDVAVNQAALMAHLIAEEMSVGDMTMLLKLRKGQFSLVEKKVHPHAAAVGTVVHDLPIPSQCVLTAIIRCGQLLLPQSDVVVEPGDEIPAVAHASVLRSLPH